LETDKYSKSEEDQKLRRRSDRDRWITVKRIKSIGSEEGARALTLARTGGEPIKV
jgi:hypothetical protein